MQFYEINICRVMIFSLSIVYTKHIDDKNWLSKQSKITSIITSAWIILLPTVGHRRSWIKVTSESALNDARLRRQKIVDTSENYERSSVIFPICHRSNRFYPNPCSTDSQFTRSVLSYHSDWEGIRGPVIDVLQINRTVWGVNIIGMFDL